MADSEEKIIETETDSALNIRDLTLRDPGLSVESNQQAILDACIPDFKDAGVAFAKAVTRAREAERVRHVQAINTGLDRIRGIIDQFPSVRDERSQELQQAYIARALKGLSEKLYQNTNKVGNDASNLLYQDVLVDVCGQYLSRNLGNVLDQNILDPESQEEFEVILTLLGNESDSLFKKIYESRGITSNITSRLQDRFRPLISQVWENLSARGVKQAQVATIILMKYARSIKGQSSIPEMKNALVRTIDSITAEKLDEQESSEG